MHFIFYFRYRCLLFLIPGNRGRTSAASREVEIAMQFCSSRLASNQSFLLRCRRRRVMRVSDLRTEDLLLPAVGIGAPQERLNTAESRGDKMGRLAGLIKGKLRAKYMRARDKL